MLPSLPSESQRGRDTFEQIPFFKNVRFLIAHIQRVWFLLDIHSELGTLVRTKNAGQHNKTKNVGPKGKRLAQPKKGGPRGKRYSPLESRPLPVVCYAVTAGTPLFYECLPKPPPTQTYGTLPTAGGHPPEQHNPTPRGLRAPTS